MGGGFALPDVLDMSIDQLKSYSIATERAKRRDNRDLLVLLRGATYEKADFKKLLKALDDDNG